MKEDGSELSTQDISDGYTATKPADPTPVAGKSFSFWTTDPTATEDSTPFSFNTPITGNITLKPVFGATVYTVTYVSAPQSVAADTFTVNSIASYSLPEPTKTGLTFVAWYTDSALTTEASVADATTLENKTLYAKWTAKVTFDPRNGESPIESDPRTYNVDTASAVKPADPTNTGATFLGWYTGTVSGSGASETVTYSTEYDFTSKVTSDITLYAKWDFVMHNVTYVSVPKDVPAGTATEFKEIEGIPTLPTLSKSGLTFVGWTDDENFTLTTTPLSSVPANTSTDVTLYAIWKVGVTFMKDTGSTTSYVVYGGALTKPTDPTKAGLTFGGWYTGTMDAEGNEILDEPYDFDNTNTNKVTRSFDLYPKWNVDISGLSTYLASLPTGTKESPNVLPAIEGLTASNWTDIATALNANSTKYVDLSATTIPDGVTDMQGGFSGCTSLVAAPVIPSGVTNMWQCFKDCTNLVTAPAIPNSVTNMYGCFNFCTSLVSAPEIPDGVISLESCFYYCTSLVTASEIPNSVTNMVNCFFYCTSLTGEIIINAEITNTSGWSNTFFLVPNTVTIKVKSDAVKNAITSAEGGEGLSNISLMN